MGPSGLLYECKHYDELDLDELYELLALRQAVFIVEQDCPYLDADGYDDKAWHILGKNRSGALKAYTRLLPAGIYFDGYASIGRVITAPDIRRSGEGQALMRYSIQQVKELCAESPIKISAQCYLTRFYRSLGFREVGEEFLEDGIPHIAMVMIPNE